MKEKNIITYYVLCNKLKNVIRTGWKDWHVTKERLESVAEHIYGVESLAIAMYSEYDYDIDISKVILMLSVHELEEIIIGDLTYYNISSEEKLKIGHEAVSKILNGLIKKDMIEKLILEFDERKTKEAVFAYHCDKLECDIQCKLYDEEGLFDISNQQNIPAFSIEKVQELLKTEDNVASMWIEFDRDKFNDDENFMKVLDYVKNNEITLKNKEDI